jgi:hypothetical protein
MTKKALLVGINYPGTNHALRGCVNDVITMSELITSKFGFTDTRNKRMLTDASATTQNIMERLEWLVDGAQPGDVLFFHYSGHGSQAINQDYNDPGFEIDGKDEIICPIDLDWRDKIIKDDDLKRVFNKVPQGVNLTVVLDCCHSGGGIDSQYAYQAGGVAAAEIINDPMNPNRARLLPMPPDIANRGLGLDLQIKPRQVQTTQDNTAILISGCQSHQTSADSFIGNKFMGAATFFIARNLELNNFSIDYKRLVELVNTELAQFGYTQRPELNGRQDLFSKNFLEPLV